MLYDFMTIDSQADKPLYRQVYEGLSEAIRIGKLRPGQRLVSIREAASFLHVSKITVEEAYRRLCVDGYVHSLPKSGYVVQETLPRQSRPPVQPVQGPTSPYRYDLGTGSVDTAASDIKIWQYHLRKVLTQRKSILSYGEPQGECSLRQELAQYVYTSRRVDADAARIVIGAGIQPLLSLLCGLLGIGGQVCLQEPMLPQAVRIFKDFGYAVSSFSVSSSNYGDVYDYIHGDVHGDAAGTVSVDRAGDILTGGSVKPSASPLAMDMSKGFAKPTDKVSGDEPEDGFDNEAGSLFASDARLCFAMPTLCANDSCYRNALFDWLARTPDRFLIEDDYNGELHYVTDSVPALQGRDPDRIIYLGSFSKLLLPSIRLSYMVLPESLMARYVSLLPSYNQTASKIEQLALAGYLHEGELERHLRKLRKQCRFKSKVFEHCFFETFGESVSLRLVESNLCFYLYPKLRENLSFGCDTSPIAVLLNAAGRAGVRLLPASAYQDEPIFIAGFSGLDADDIPLAIKRLHEAWKGYLSES